MLNGNKKQNKFLTLLNQFYNSDWFMLLYSLIVFSSWLLECEYIAVISTVLILCYMFLTQTSLDRLIMIAIIIPAMVDKNMRHRIGYNQIFILALMILPVIVCAIYHFLKIHKSTGRQIKRSQLFLGYFLAIIIGFIAGFGYEGQTVVDSLMAAGVGFALWGLYVLLYKCTAPESKKTVIKSVICLCIVIVLQMITFFITSTNLKMELMHKAMDLGWAITNSVAVIFVMGIPLCVELARDKRVQFPYLLLMTIFYVFIFLTNCRSMIIAGSLIYFASVVCSMFTLNKWQSCAHLILVIGLAIIIYRNHLDVLLGQFDRLGMDDNGRLEKYRYYWAQFKENKLFGMGFFNDTKFQSDGMVRVHNTILQILTSTGIIGTILFLPMYFQRYKAFLTKISWFKVFAVLSYGAFVFYGLVDCAILSSYKLIIVYLLLFAVESDTIEIKTQQSYLIK